MTSKPIGSMRVGGERAEETLNLQNRGAEVLHNHESSPRIVYSGYCPTAPCYHTFACERLSDLPRRVVHLVPFDPTRFISEDSKARKGGCSMRRCMADAVMMSDKGRHAAYCTDHAANVSSTRRPCLWTSIKACTRILQMEGEPNSRPCLTCQAFEGKEVS